MPVSARNARTIRTAAAFSSTEYLRVVGFPAACSLAINLILAFQGQKSPPHPGRFKRQIGLRFIVAANAWGWTVIALDDHGQIQSNAVRRTQKAAWDAVQKELRHLGVPGAEGPADDD